MPTTWIAPRSRRRSDRWQAVDAVTTGEEPRARRSHRPGPSTGRGTAPSAPPSGARPTAARRGRRRAWRSSGSAPSPGSSRPCSASSRKCVTLAARRLGRGVGDLQVGQQARRHGPEVVGRPARAGEVQRVDEHGAVRVADLGHDADGVGERPDGEDRQELEDDDDARRRGPLAQLAEALDDGRPLGRATGHQHVAHAELGGRVDERVAGVVAAAEDHRLDVERRDAGGRAAGGRRRRSSPSVHVAGSNQSPTASKPAAAAASTVPGGSRSSTVPAASDSEPRADAHHVAAAAPRTAGAAPAC